ncbi:MAG: hypothetical protein V4805_03040 [Pseudomonadota bacterium]
MHVSISPSYRIGSLSLIVAFFAMGGTAWAIDPPSISTATIAGGSINLVGAGFGTKPQAAPHHFEDFDSRTPGALPATFGYVNYGGFGGVTSVDNAVSYSGGSALRHQPHSGAVSGSDVDESFPHIAVRGFSSTELYLSYRLKFKTNMGSRIAQLKFNRSGMEVANSHGGPCYGSRPKFRSSYYPNGPSVNRYSADKTLAFLQGGIETDDVPVVIDEGWVGEKFPGPAQVILEDTWVQVEEYYRLNDIGQSNGEHVTYVNGHRNFDHHQLLLRHDASKVINCSYLVIGMDYWINSPRTNPNQINAPTVWYDDHYLDTSRARVVLANAATWTAATIRTPQPATLWQTGKITAQLKRAGFAKGSDAWLYVVRADGSTSAGQKIRLDRRGAPWLIELLD